LARARDRARGLRHSRHLRDDFERVAHLVHELDRRLASRAEHRPHDRDHHPRDRYDRVALFSLSFGSR
jgi:hypothetical protein